MSLPYTYVDGKRTPCCGSCGRTARLHHVHGTILCWRCFGWHQLRRLGVCEDWRDKIRERDTYCRYCGATDRPLDQDHVIPKSKGGVCSPWNIVLACRSCQDRKADRTVHECAMFLLPVLGEQEAAS